MPGSEHDDEKPFRLIQSGINDILRQLAEMRADAERRDEVARERMNRIEGMVWDHRERIGRIEKQLESESRVTAAKSR
jgi:hypothetical protein